MRQGQDRGKSGGERRGTSRVNKPATSRMNAQSGGTSRSETQHGGGAPAQDNKTTMYMAIGGGALVFVLILAFMLGGEESSHSGGGGGETMMKTAINKSQEAFMRGEYRASLDIAEDALKDPRSRKSSRLKSLEACANMARTQVNLDRDGAIKVAEFKRKVDAAVADQTAMAKANGFWQECLQLESQFGATSAKKTLKDIKEDLRRWVATEGQGNWQKDYNVTKGRIEKSFLAAQKFSEAIREWQRFGETSAQDPLLHSRIEQEIRTVNQMAQAAAEKLVADAGTGADARSKIEEGQQQFNGTDGQAVINKALKNLK